MRITRLCAAVVVGGAVTFGSIAPAAADGILTIGQGDHDGGQVDVLPVENEIDELVTVTVQTPTDDLVARLQVGGTAPSSSDGNLGSFLAKPLPLKVCVLCNPGSEQPA